MGDMHLLEPLEMSVTSNRFMDGYDFEPTKHKWLANIFWKALTRLGALKQRYGTEKTYKLRDPKNAQSVVDAVANALRNAERFFHRPGEYAVVMGHETYRDLMREQSPLMPMGGRSFEFVAGVGYNGRIFNVPVHVVETVKGVAVIPKIVIEKNSP